jgi:hypothetical protein
MTIEGALPMDPRMTVRMVAPATNERGSEMLIWGLGAVVYIALFLWLGLLTLRNGHGWLFFFGIFFPILWIFGAFSRPTDDRAAAPQA